MGKKATIKRVEEDNTTFEKVFEDFQFNNKARGLSENTIQFYNNNLIALRVFLEESGIEDLSGVNKKDFNNFVLWLRDGYENTTTINTYLRAARTFFYFAMDEGYISEFRITLAQPQEKVKETYTEEEIKRLLQKPNLRTCSFQKYRNWVLVQYLLDTGNRLNTVRHMKVEDIDLQAGMAVLRTVKNNKQQFSPLSKPLVKNLRDYIKTWGLQSEDYLFPNVERGQLSKDGMVKAVARYNHSRGVNKTSIHAFRHSFAMNYVKTGGNAFKLQRLLGHSTLEVTRTYINLFGQDLAQDFAKHSIIEKHSQEGKRLRRG